MIALLKRRPAVKRSNLEKSNVWKPFVEHIKTKFPNFDEKSFNS
jgi:hypothetical protein